MSNQPTIFHIHIPKSAGSSLNKSLVNSTEGLKFAYTDSNRDCILKPNKNEVPNFSLVFGHFDYGLHRYLENSYLNLFLLRKPKDRLFSFYNYVKVRSDHPLSSPVNSQKLSFGEFLEWGMNVPDLCDELNNGQVRRISGYPKLNKYNIKSGFITACVNANSSNSIVGVMERYPEYLELLYRRNILNCSKIEELNINKKKEKKYHLNSMQLELLEHLSHWDSLLWEFCLSVFMSYEEIQDYN